ANAASDLALPPPTSQIPETVSPPAAIGPQSSVAMAETSSDPSKKRKKKTEEQKITPAPPKFLVADTVAPLNKKGFLKAPEPSIETSELWSSQITLKARVFRTAPQQEARNLLSNGKLGLDRLTETYGLTAGLTKLSN
ncbi:hypothetical protein PIB30_095853, partial [Stylosanthes scabra]|nr:hypothetical protein [Stylosanthes scabra]